MTKHQHKVLFGVFYVAMPVMMAWIGHEVSQFGFSGESLINHTQHSIYRSVEGAPLSFYDLPRVSLSMGTNAGTSAGTLKLDVSLEVPSKEVQRVIDFEPRIMEKILFYMRQQSYETFHQPNGARDLRKGLENEIRTGAFPIQIAQIYVRKMVFE